MRDFHINGYLKTGVLQFDLVTSKCTINFLKFILSGLIFYFLNVGLIESVNLFCLKDIIFTFLPLREI